jgi:iron complex transport system substrate-binding protein
VLRLSAAGLMVLALTTTAAAAKPQRIASLNLCTDQLALLLVNKSRIVSISFLGKDPAESPLAAAAEDIPANHGEAEEILAVHPDLVLAGEFTTTFARDLLRRLGFPVVEVPIPESIAEIGRVLRQVAAAVGESERAEQLIAEMDQRLARVAADRGPRGTALVYDANGFTYGRPSIMEEVMTIVGLDNTAAALGVGPFGDIPLEAVLIAKPDYLVHLVYKPGAASLAEEMTRHPALQDYRRSHRMLELPGNLFGGCDTPLVAQAAEQLAALIRK